MNVCPWRMAKRLGVKEKHLSAPSIYLRAYDYSKWLALGTILVLIKRALSREI